MKKLLFILPILFLCFAPHAQAAVAFVQSTSTAVGANQNFATASFNSNVTANDMVAVFAADGDGVGSITNVTSSCVTGNLTIAANDTATLAAGMAYGIVNASGPCTVSVTFSTSAVGNIVVLHEVSGVAMTNPIDTTSTQITSFNTAWSTGSFRTKVSGDYLFVAAVNGSGRSYSSGMGYTLRENSTAGYASEDQVQGLAGLSAATLTSSANATGRATVVAFKPAVPVVPDIALVQSTSTAATNYITHNAISFPNNLTAGNLIIVAVNGGGSVPIAAPTDSLGNTFKVAVAEQTTAEGNCVNSPVACRSSIYYAENVKGGADTINVSSSDGTASDFINIAIFEYSGAATANSLDATSTAQSVTTSATSNSGNITTTESGELLFASHIDDLASGAQSYVAGNGFTIQEDNTDAAAVFIFEDQDKIAASPVTASSSVMMGTASYWLDELAAFKPADITPPSVSLMSPLSGATVSSTITLSASSTDNVAVAGVQFQIDGTNLGSLITATSGPTIYSTSWNTASSSDGTHIISAIAYDTSNNSSTASSSVTVHNAVQSNPPPATPVVSVGVPASYGTPNYNLSTSPTNIASPPPSQVSTSSLEAIIVSLQSELQSLIAQVPAQNFAFTRNLSLWSTGADVQALQTFLIQQSKGSAAQKLKANGTTQTFGFLTYDALKEYQASVGLPATGFFGILTREKIQSSGPAGLHE